MAKSIITKETTSVGITTDPKIIVPVACLNNSARTEISRMTLICCASLDSVIHLKCMQHNKKIVGS